MARIFESESVSAGQNTDAPSSPQVKKRHMKMAAEKATKQPTLPERNDVVYQMGFFSEELFAERLGLSTRRVRDFQGSGFIGGKYAKAVTAMANAEVLPIAVPPGRIGWLAGLAFAALVKGDPETAEALSAKAIRKRERSWYSGQIDSEVQTPLMRFYAQLANGIAWSQNPHWATCKGGLPKLFNLSWELRKYLKPDHRRDTNWPAWRYLYVTIESYRLAYMVSVAALGLFETETPYPQDPSKLSSAQRAKRAADSKSAICAFRDFVERERARGMDFESALRAESTMSIRVWWNLAQLASVADDDQIFEECLHKLQALRVGPPEELVKIMEDDPDTLRMMRKPGVIPRLLSTPIQ